MRTSTVRTNGRRVFVLAMAVGVLGLQGCGSGDGKATENTTAPAIQQQEATGTLEFRVVFPQAKHKAATSRPLTRAGGGYSGAIPQGSHAVTIKVSDPASGVLLAPVRMVADTTRPDGVTGAISVGFALLRVGPVKIDVVAFPDVAAEGNPLATGSNTVQVEANTITTASILLELTFNKLVVSPRTQTLHLNGGPTTGMVDAQARDAQGKPILYPLEYFSDNPQIAAVTAVSPDFMHATITPSQGLEGTQTIHITVVEPNSGTSDTVDVVVGP